MRVAGLGGRSGAQAKTRASRAATSPGGIELAAGIGAGAALHAALLWWPPAQAAFRTVPVGLPVLAALAGLASAVLWADEAVKALGRLRGGR